MSALAHDLLHLHGIAALALVFVFPALEASIFLGFVFPGEIAAILGGVLASQHRINFAAAVAAVVAGAIAGNVAGYFVGRWAGGRLLMGPLSRWVRVHHVDKARSMMQRRGAWAVLLGRWAAGLRVLVPGIAGMAGMSFGSFLLFTVIGGIAWGTTMVIAGWVAGSHWHSVVNTLGLVGIGVLVAIVVAVVVAVFLVRRRRAARGY